MKKDDELIVLSELGISLQDMIEKYPKLIEPICKPSVLGFTRREFFYWTEIGAIDINKNEDGQSPWSRINLLQVIWIRIVQELRLFNFPFTAIVQLKSELLKNILKTFLDESEKVKIILENTTLNKEFIESYMKLIEEGKNSEQTEDPFLELVTPLGSMLFEIFMLQRKISLHIYKENEQYKFLFQGYSLQHLSNSELDFIKNKTHITLFLNEIIADYLVDTEYEKINKQFGFITEKEIEILEAIRDKEISEITINKDKNESLTYTCTKRSELKDEQVQMIKRILRMNEFNDVRVVLRNDKHIYLENKTRKKL